MAVFGAGVVAVEVAGAVLDQVKFNVGTGSWQRLTISGIRDGFKQQGLGSSTVKLRAHFLPDAVAIRGESCAATRDQVLQQLGTDAVFVCYSSETIWRR